MAEAECQLTLQLALDPLYWRADDKSGWAESLVGAVEAAAPRLISVEGYEIRDTLLYVRLRGRRSRTMMQKLLHQDDGLRRLRARLADMGARGEFEVSRARRR